MEVWIVDLTIKFPKNYQFGASFVNDLQQTSVRASFLRQTKKIPDTLSDFTSVLFHFNPVSVDLRVNRNEPSSSISNVPLAPAICPPKDGDANTADS